MFSQETVMLEIDARLLENGDASKAAEFLTLLSNKPAAARGKRSSIVLSFEKARVRDFPQDPRAELFLSNLERAAPFMGYFLNGDAPFFHLRKVSAALARNESGILTTKTFIAAHYRLYQAAEAHCLAVGDSQDAMEEVFVVNLPHEILREDARSQARAMRELHPILLMTMVASAGLRRVAFAEAERIWGRPAADFSSAATFVREFEKAFRKILP
jgi:hypothetical protein